MNQLGRAHAKACTAHTSHAKRASPKQLAKLAARLERGLRAGGCGLGLGLAYTAAAGHAEVQELFELGALIAEVREGAGGQSL